MRIIFLMIVASAFCFFCGSCSFSEISLFNQFGKIEASGPAYTVRTTAYSHREKEQGGKYGALTASGRRLRYGRIRSAGQIGQGIRLALSSGSLASHTLI